jgi:serine protease
LKTEQVITPDDPFTSGMSVGVISTVSAGTSSPGADAFGYKQGTSMATAHVSAVAALMSVEPPYPEQLDNML